MTAVEAIQLFAQLLIILAVLGAVGWFVGTLLRIAINLENEKE